MSVPANLVAAEFNITIYRLQSILQYALDLDIAVDQISSTELIKTIENLNGENSYYPISDNLYKVLKEQYSELKDLRTLEEISREYQVSQNSLEYFVHQKIRGGGQSPFYRPFKEKYIYTA